MALDINSKSENIQNGRWAQSKMGGVKYQKWHLRRFTLTINKRKNALEINSFKFS